MRTDPEFCTPEFFTYVLNPPMTNARVREMKGGASSRHLNVVDVKAFPIPLPHPNEQQEVVRRMEALFALADAAERRLAASRTDRLTQSLLAQAFRGELVPTEAALARQQNRPYEPATELLARIGRDGRNSQQKAGKPKNRSKPKRETPAQ